MVGLSMSDIGLWRSDTWVSARNTFFTYTGTYNDIVNFGPVGMTDSGYAAEQVIEPQYHADVEPTGVLPITGASPEGDVFGNLTGTITGTSVVAGPTLFQPFATKASFNNANTSHSPGAIRLTLSWQSGNAPGSPVAFTPSVPGVGYSWSPSTITLTGSPTTGNTETGSAVLSVPGGMTSGTPIEIDVTNTGGVGSIRDVHGRHAGRQDQLGHDDPERQCAMAHGKRSLRQPRSGHGADLHFRRSRVPGGTAAVRFRPRGNLPGLRCSRELVLGVCRAARSEHPHRRHGRSLRQARDLAGERQHRSVVAIPELQFVVGEPAPHPRSRQGDDRLQHGRNARERLHTESRLHDPRPGRRLHACNLYRNSPDVYPDNPQGGRNAKQIYGTATTNATYASFRRIGHDQPLDRSDRRGDFDSSYPFYRWTLIGQMTAAATTATVTVTDGTSSGVLYTNGIRCELVPEPFMQAGDTVTFQPGDASS